MEYQILQILKWSQPCTRTQLLDALKCSTHDLSHTIREMLEDGLLYAAPQPGGGIKFEAGRCAA